jgi:membrane protein
MTVKARMRRGLDKVHGATTTARLVLETTRASLRYLNVLVDTVAITIGITYGRSGARGLIRTRALSLSLYLAALVFGVVILPLVLLGPTLIDGWLPEPLRFAGSLYWPAVAVATVAALTTLFHVATPREARWWRAAPGAGLALVIWVLASFVVRGSVGLPLDGTSLNGSLSASIVVLIWFFAVAIAVLIGAGLNAATRVLWPVPVHLAPTDGLVEWARAEMERRRSYGQGDGDPLLDDLVASEQQYLDLAWPPEPRQVEHRRAS